jgi:hypothetical protein
MCQFYSDCSRFFLQPNVHTAHIEELNWVQNNSTLFSLFNLFDNNQSYTLERMLLISEFSLTADASERPKVVSSA